MSRTVSIATSRECRLVSTRIRNLRTCRTITCNGGSVNRIAVSSPWNISTAHTRNGSRLLKRRGYTTTSNGDNMTAKYKVIGRTTQRPKHLLGVYCCPDEVVTLIEDIQLLERVIELLGKLDRSTISDDDNEAGVTVRRLSFIVYAIRNRAKDKLARDYLAGQPPIKPRVKPQTMADIWALFKDSLDRNEAP